jgi:hypothetical protein
MRPEAADWLAHLPAVLDRHRETLRALTAVAESDDRIRLLVVGCSIGRGVADSLSDIDAYMGIAKGAWPAFLSDVDALVKTLGEFVDLYHKTMIPPGKAAYQFTFVQYANGVPLELVVAEAPESRARPADWVVLHDPDDRVKGEATPGYGTIEEVRDWSQAAWTRLGGCAKYLARGSLWEALEMLHLARTDAWRLWAVAHHIADPQYGLTAVLDTPSAPLPPNISGTVPRLDRAEIMRAALACADLLDATWPRATSAVLREQLEPMPLAGWVRRNLAALALAES